MSTERDTHFLGFAQLLWQKYVAIDASWFDRVPDEEFVQEVQTAFAQAAYDFARHLLAQLLLARDIEQELHEVPDMTEWPEQEKEVATGEMNAWQRLEAEMGEPFADCIHRYLTETCHLVPTELVSWEIGASLADEFAFKVLGECYHATVRLTFPDEAGVQCKTKNINDVWSIML